MPCAYDYEPGDEYCDLFEERAVVARKNHRCEECGATIQKGEKHEVAKGLYEGQWSEARRCPACVILAELVATLNEACPLWGGLDASVDLARDEGHDVPTPQEHRKQWEAA